MAKIMVDFDTAEKTLAVTLDGKKIKNVSEVLFMSFAEGSGGVEIKTMEFNEDDSIFKVTRILASDEGDVITVRTEPNKPETPNTADMARVLLQREV